MQLNLHALVLASLALLAAAAPVAVPTPDTPVLARDLADTSDNTVALPVDVFSDGNTQIGHALSYIGQIDRRKDAVSARDLVSVDNTVALPVDVYGNGNTQLGHANSIIDKIARRKAIFARDLASIDDDTITLPVDVFDDGDTQLGDGISTIGRRKDVVSARDLLSIDDNTTNAPVNAHGNGNTQLGDWDSSIGRRSEQRPGSVPVLYLTDVVIVEAHVAFAVAFGALF
ncbi:hypothetical protein IEO21_04703 [Rhodonia placenta]|uniref:Uncharacterized protein n=1 Tax=Rhodonia placenta TaxID=104341 RepID=A0A8H7P3D4_9APHY|nr:hypothetical protein IEO21_04703 [Postia placenta]